MHENWSLTFKSERPTTSAILTCDDEGENYEEELASKECWHWSFLPDIVRCKVTLSSRLRLGLWISIRVREVFKKKNAYKAVRLTAWVDPPLPSPEAVRKMWKFFDKLSYLGLFCHFIKDKMGQNFHKIEAVRLDGGGPPPPPQAVSLTAL